MRTIALRISHDPGELLVQYIIQKFDSTYETYIVLLLDKRENTHPRIRKLLTLKYYPLLRTFYKPALEYNIKCKRYSAAKRDRLHKSFRDL
jgi:hypothetical protein